VGSYVASWKFVVPPKWRITIHRCGETITDFFFVIIYFFYYFQTSYIVHETYTIWREKKTHHPASIKDKGKMATSVDGPHFGRLFGMWFFTPKWDFDLSYILHTDFFFFLMMKQIFDYMLKDVVPNFGSDLQRIYARGTISLWDIWQCCQTSIHS
jgi:hypothetical protein